MAANELERKLGHAFSQPSLLVQALTHRSFGTPHNERLEFLGDSVLNCAVARRIFEYFPAMPEGELSRLRANLVNQTTLAEIAGQLSLGGLLRMGEGELRTHGAERPSTLADAFEAVLGAVFLDAGYVAAAAIVDRIFAERIRVAGGTTPTKDAKTALQEWLQARRLPLPRYSVLKIEGAAHKQLFHVRCEIDSQSVTTNGQGTSRRIAEQEAASHALAAIRSSEGAA